MISKKIIFFTIVVIVFFHFFEQHNIDVIYEVRIDIQKSNLEVWK